MAKGKQAKQVQVIARYALKREGKLTGVIVYAVRSSNGKGSYRTTLVNGKATGCTCPARKPCCHMTQLEAIEAARPTITVGEQVASGATPAQAVKKAVALLKQQTPASAQSAPVPAVPSQPVVTPSAQPVKQAPTLARVAERRMEEAPLNGNRGFSLLKVS